MHPYGYASDLTIRYCKVQQLIELMDCEPNVLFRSPDAFLRVCSYLLCRALGAHAA